MKFTRSRNLISAIAIMLIALIPYSFTWGKAAEDDKQAWRRQVLKFNGEEVSIIRDDFGVPHILAETSQGVYYGGGYAVAQDRLYQLERLRRDARGEIAEIEGPQAFQRDLQTRQLGYTEQQFRAAFDSLSEAMKQSYEAYAEGINAYIAQAVTQNLLPARFKESGIDQPPPWKVTDSVAIGIMMENRFGAVGGAELTNARVMKKLEEKFGKDAGKVFNDLIWINDRKAPTTIPGAHKSSAASNHLIEAPQKLNSFADGAIAEADRSARQIDMYEYAKGHDLPTGWGSFFWVISSRLSASGFPVLVGNPQMGASTPPLPHEIHYSTKDLNVIGIGFAGFPGVILGHNDNLAWSMTSGASDMKDVFAEKLSPDNKRQYFYKGKYQDMEVRTEVIKIKGEKPREVEVYRTAHGPVVGWDNPKMDQANIAYSLATSYAGHEMSTFEAIYGFNYAKGIKDFAKLCELIYSNHNFAAASVEGDIGYWHTGRLPLRAAGQDGRLPVPGTGEYDWQGFAPSSKMPQLINPKQGYLINYNNKPAPWYDNGDVPYWGEVQFLRTVENVIASRGTMTFEQIRDINQYAGTIDGFAESLKPYLLAAIDKTQSANSDPRIKEAASHLRAWDNHKTNGSVAKVIFDAWLDQARSGIFADELGDLLTDKSPFFTYRVIAANMILHVFEGAASGLPPTRDYLNGKSKESVIIEALVRALDQLTKDRGEQMNLWTYDQGTLFLRPLPGIPFTNRGTYTFIAEMSKPLIRSESILPPGQSENPQSPHYSDQRELAGFWRFKPLLYKREQLKKFLNPESASSK